MKLFSSIVVSVLATGLAQAQVTKECSALDAVGHTVSGGALSGVTAGGQSGGVMTSEAGDLTLYAGFLGCITLAPTLDTDGDGVANEIDRDNDNDDLTDVTESTGGAFNPVTVTDLNDADSDDDGASDWLETRTQTNPLDDTSYLRIISTSVNANNGVASITWTARGGMSYRVRRRADPSQALPGSVASPVRTATGGSPPWYETTRSHSGNLPVGDSRVFHIQVVP